MNYDLNTLEFNKVLEELSKFASTNYAKRRISELTPFASYEEILESSNETKCAFDACVKLSNIPLGGLYDVLDYIKRARIGSILSEQELLDIVGLIDCSNNALKYFKQLDGIKVDTTVFEKYYSKINIPSVLKTNINLAIGDDARVLDNASRELFMIRRNIISLNNRLKAKLNEILTTRASQLTESLIVQRDGRMCVPVKIEHKNTFKGILHDISSSNTTAYIEPESCVETANQIESYKAMEKKEIAQILKSLSLLVASEADVLTENLEALTSLDVIYAKALMAKAYDYNDVKILDKQSFNIKKCKHPLIDREKVVPIDIELGNKFNAIVITGPNTGGKTVALKTVGLLHVMVMCGMMVPAASDSEFGIFDEILVDIGDEQSIEQSLSTFSAHMSKVIRIIENTSFKSLVLLDELGSGTDPKEGSSLAITIIDQLKSIGAKIIATTHYSDLKNYAYNSEGVCNASVEFNTNTLMPTYRLLLGVPGKSNAIEISKRLGLPDKIIEDAKSHIESTSSTSSLMLQNLEEEMTSLREKEEELARKIEEQENLISKLNKEKFDLAKQTSKIIDDAKKEARKIIEKSKEDANQLLDEIKNLSSSAYKEHELADLKHKARNINVKDEEENVFDEELVVGDYVYVKTYDKNGTIIKIKKDKYSVNIGQFTMDFTKKELIKAQKPQEKKKRETRMSGYNPASHAALSLDLRGKRYEEVNYLMDQYLDQAILGNLETVNIIHGFGTGTIRNAVQEYLKKCPYVKKYRYGVEGEGLNGVTVVYLK